MIEYAAILSVVCLVLILGTLRHLAVLLERLSLLPNVVLNTLRWHRSEDGERELPDVNEAQAQLVRDKVYIASCKFCVFYVRPRMPEPLEEEEEEEALPPDWPRRMSNSPYVLEPEHFERYGTCCRFPPPGSSPRLIELEDLYREWRDYRQMETDGYAEATDRREHLGDYAVWVSQVPPRGRFPFVAEDDWCGEYVVVDERTHDQRREYDPVEQWKERYAKTLAGIAAARAKKRTSQGSG